MISFINSLLYIKTRINTQMVGLCLKSSLGFGGVFIIVVVNVFAENTGQKLH